MIRPSLRGLAVLLTGSAALLATTLADGGVALTSGTLVPTAAAQGVCARPSLGSEDAILMAAENYMLSSDSASVFGYARLQRVEGDFARVVLVPATMTDHALLFLQKDRTGTWKVVAGPGTSFEPSDVPGGPRAIFEHCPA